jgi:pimeloyl-ACP methyl ester carboxylesterase
MSTTGDLDVGQPTPEAAMLLLRPRATDRAGAIAADLEVSRVIGSPDHFDPERAQRHAALSYDRCFHPAGVGHQLLAILGSGSRTAALSEVKAPTLVVHGDVDPLVDVSGGRRTAEAVPGAELVVLEGMGHDLPPVYWPTLIERITALAARADATAA